MKANNERTLYGPVKMAKGAFYTGEMVSGKRDGYGQLVYPDGTRYDGHWL